MSVFRSLISKNQERKKNRKREEQKTRKKEKHHQRLERPELPENLDSRTVQYSSPSLFSSYMEVRYAVGFTKIFLLMILF